MSLALYMDENVPIAITEGLRLRNVDVITVQADGLTSYPDPKVFDRAIELNRIVFSMDQDFLTEGKLRQQKGESFPGVIFARQTKVSIGACVTDLELIAKLGNPEEFANQVRYLPL
jgi:predicted nuclease of predicted toxin-antitoxin system